MRTRIISAIVAIALFIVIIYVLPQAFFTAAVCVVCAMAAYELTYRSKIVSSRLLASVACGFAFLTPLFFAFNELSQYLLAFMFLIVFSMFFIWLTNIKSINLTATLCSVFAAFVLPVMFSHILLIRAAENGEYWLLLPFFAAWMTDTGAYFVGVFFGRHKLCEKISPKKTVEGAVGGVLVCILSLLLFGKGMERAFGTEINYIILTVCALVLSLVAQIGDLSFSIIKREYNIKDYGNLMPGHGGVLDRFDSAMFTIPASYILLSLMGGIF